MKLEVPFLVLSVGQACNLRCKNCANFAPYALPEMRKYPIESIISDFEALFKAVGKINSLQIQGGEPLIYQDLPKLVAYLATCPEIENIVIATNGIFTPSDMLMYICSVLGVQFRVSNYPQNTKNLSSIAEKAKKFNVNVSTYDFASNEALWFDCGGLDTPRENDDSVVAERFNRCSFKGCLTLENGELHRCSRAANAYKLQGFESVDGDFVKVRDNKNLYEDMLSYYAPPRFENACRYCNGTFNVRKIPAAEQI